LNLLPDRREVGNWFAWAIMPLHPAGRWLRANGVQSKSAVPAK
jgi:hypothetical protein